MFFILYFFDESILTLHCGVEIPVEVNIYQNCSFNTTEMSLVELIPLNKGHPVILDHTVVTTIGRSPKIGCNDNKISRNHAQLFIKSDGTVWIKGIHQNPTFYKTKTNQIVSLTKDKEYQLYNNDQFGLLPDEYFYRVSIKSKDEDRTNHSDQNSTICSSTTSKSPIKEKETLTIEDHVEENSESVSNQTHPLPTSTTANPSSVVIYKEERSQAETTSSIPPVNKQTEEKKTKDNVYDDDTDDEPTSTTTEQASASNRPTTSSVTRSSKRERCHFGASCYRTNPIHRQQAIHPGDSDWDTDDDDDDDEKEEENAKPVCPYGDECYRTNPDHFNEYDHPNMKTKDKGNLSIYEDDDEDSSEESDDAEDADNDIEWKPNKNPRYFDDSDDDSANSSDRELTEQEAERFVKSSTNKHHGHVIKKPRAEDDE